MTDAELLNRYAETSDQAAFAELARRHTDLVYSAARRLVGGDHHRAAEVTQTVFIDLARKAAALKRHPVLIAWLYQAARMVAHKVRRADLRRLAREDAALRLNEAGTPSAHEAALWANLCPVIEDAMSTLGERDRQVVLLRYFSGQAYADIGQKLGLAENTARMRTERALEKLSRALAKRGVTSTASALGLALGNNAVTAAPAFVATSTLTTLASSTAVAAAATTATATTTALLTTMATSTKLTLGVSAVTLFSLGVGLGLLAARRSSATVAHATAPVASPASLAQPAPRSATPVVQGQADTNLALNRRIQDLENALSASQGKIAKKEEQMRFLQDVSGYLLSGTDLEIPKGLAETSIFAGQLHRLASQFRQKWGGDFPDQTDPAYAEFLKERDALAKDTADLAKAMHEINLPAVISEPKQLSEFQSLQFYSALELDSATWAQLRATLARNYDAGFQRKLNGAHRPADDATAWEAERNTLSTQVYREILGILPPDKRAGFERLYGPDFFWTIKIDGM